MTTPDTVTEALSFLAAEGYSDEYQLCPAGLMVPDRPDAHPIETAVVDYTFRFEGASDPGDEAIVLGVRCPEWGRKGVVVSAFGPAADPEHTQLLIALAKPAHG